MVENSILVQVPGLGQALGWGWVHINDRKQEREGCSTTIPPFQVHVRPPPRQHLEEIEVALSTEQKRTTSLRARPFPPLLTFTITAALYTQSRFPTRRLGIFKSPPPFQSVDLVHQRIRM
jgi:hypothetical protein